MPMRPKQSLSELESRVMEVVWAQGEVTADSVRTILADDRPLKDSTVRTILRRLKDKGYVRYETEGRTYVYSPTVASRSVAVDAVRGIIERFCDGSVEDLLLGMVDREVISPAKLKQLAERIANAKTDSGRKSTTGRRSRKRE